MLPMKEWITRKAYQRWPERRFALVGIHMLFEHVSRNLGVDLAIIRRIVRAAVVPRPRQRKRCRQQQRIHQHSIPLAVSLAFRLPLRFFAINEFSVSRLCFNRCFSIQLTPAD